MSKLLFFSFLSGLWVPPLVFHTLIMPSMYFHNNGIANDAESRKNSSECLHVWDICDCVIANCNAVAPLKHTHSRKGLPQHLWLLLYCGSWHNYGHYYHYYYYYDHCCVVCVMLAMQLILLLACWEAGSCCFSHFCLVSDKVSAPAVHNSETPPLLSLLLSFKHVPSFCFLRAKGFIWCHVCANKQHIYSVTVLLLILDIKHWVVHFCYSLQLHGSFFLLLQTPTPSYSASHKNFDSSKFKSQCEN